MTQLPGALKGGGHDEIMNPRAELNAGIRERTVDLQERYTGRRISVKNIWVKNIAVKNIAVKNISVKNTAVRKKG